MLVTAGLPGCQHEGSPQTRLPPAAPPLEVSVEVDEGRLVVTRPSDGARARVALHVEDLPTAKDRSTLTELLR